MTTAKKVLLKNAQGDYLIPYIPPATSNNLGSVKVGNGLNVSSEGIVSVDSSITNSSDLKLNIDLSNISTTTKTIITNLVMPNYGAQIIGSSRTWVQAPVNSFVCVWGTDPYMENYQALVSPDTTYAYYAVGFKYDDFNNNTDGISFTFFVPKDWYFINQAENGFEYRINPLIGVS